MDKRTSDIKVEDGKHSLRGASGAYRWMNCQGSPRLIEKLGSKARSGGLEADLGTAAHQIGAMCLQQDRDAWEFLGQIVEVKGTQFEVDQEMSESVQLYVDFVREKLEQHKDKGAILLVETGMSSMLDEDAYGTADVTIYVPGDRIIIVDYKNGIHVCCEPHEEQTRYYGYLALENARDYLSREEADFKVAELFIVQPRMTHPKGPIRQFVTDPSELEHFFVGEVVPAMAGTRQENALLAIGDWCGFCPARKHCPALQHETLNFDVTTEPGALTNEELGALLKKKKAIGKCLEDAETEAFRREMSGSRVPGQKLVKKKANRVFKESMKVADEDDADKTMTVRFADAVVDEFGDDAYQPTAFKTPPNIAGLGPAGKKFVARWAFSPDTGYTLAPESDKRIRVKPTMEEYMERHDTE